MHGIIFTAEFHGFFLRPTLPGRITYSEDMSVGPKYLRVWQLSYRTDFGLPGMADPFDMVALMELVLTQGFLDCSLLTSPKTSLYFHFP